MHTKHWLLTGLFLATLPAGAWLVSAQAGEAPVQVYVLNASFSDSLQQKIITGRVDIGPSMEESDILGSSVKLYLSEGEDDSLRYFGEAPLVRIVENGVPEYVYEFRAAGTRGGMVAASVEVPGYGTVRSKRVHNSTYTVTSTANTTDANTADGLCDIDTGTPGSQCTFVAAIAQGNTDNAAGLHTTNFNIPASDTRHYCYMNDGVSGQITIANERTTTTTDDPACGGTTIDPDHPYSWFRLQAPATYLTFSPVYSSATILRTFDGTTQPGARANSAGLFEGYLASDARGAIQKIEITGTGFFADSLSNTSAITFRGVVMNEPGIVFSAYYGMFASSNGGFTGLKFKGSYFGTDISGTRDVTTTTCFLGRVGGNNGFAYYGEIGGPDAADRVIVSGFSTAGNCNNAQLTVYRSGGWTIENAFWGTDVTGTQDLGNAGTYQITSGNGCYNYGGDRLTVRSSVISGNDGGAISVYSCTGDIRNNRIGVNAAGTASLPNGSAVGIYFGSTAAAGRGKIVNNIIGGHTYGIHGYYAYNYDIGGNYIGVTPNGTSVPNTSGGMYLDRAGSALVTVGGGTGSGNIVRNNTNVGIRNTYGASANVSIYGNTVYNNSGLGIQSTGTRPTVTTANANGSTIAIAGTSSCSTANCRLHFYRNTSTVSGSVDGTGYGEAYEYLGTYSGTTGAYSTTVSSTATGGNITATQTTLSSTGVLLVTSEFATNLAITNIYAPDMFASVSTTGSPWTQGGSGTFVITVTNTGALTTTTTYTVGDTFPTGMTLDSYSGTGWTCTASGSNAATCTRSTALAPLGTSVLTINVDVSTTATLGARTNSVRVSGGGQTVTSNDTSTSSVTVNGCGVNATTWTADASAGNGTCADSVGVCSLRAALEEFNANGVGGTVRFCLSGAAPYTITPTTTVTITKPVVIDGRTQPGYSTVSRKPLVRVAAGSAVYPISFGAGSDGSRLIAINTDTSSTVPTIRIVAPNVKLFGNYIGTNVGGASTGSSPGGTGASGISCESSGAQIGGTQAGSGNLISGNYDGIMLTAGCTNPIVEGNYIGLNGGGTGAIANTRYGIHMYSTSTAVSGIVIGGPTSASRNIISGNGTAGIYDVGRGSYWIQNNYIGTNPAGTAAFSNGIGIHLNDAATDSYVKNNLISGNANYGIHAQQSRAGAYHIYGNTIGLSATGGGLGNGVGFLAQMTNYDLYFGSVTSGSGNTVAYSGTDGVNDLTGASRRIIMRGNSVYNNTQQGRDINQDNAVTYPPNSTCSLGAVPYIPTVSTVTTNGATTTITGTVDGPSGSYVDLYWNSAADSSGYGEGQTYIGTATIGALTSGCRYNWSATVTSPGTAGVISALHVYAATRTSEFSSTVAYTAPDLTAPTLSSTSPLDNATDVADTTNLVLTFSEAVRPVSGGTITIKRTSDNSTMDTISVTSGSVTGSGTNTITVDPDFTYAFVPAYYASLLSYSTEYYVQVSAGAFEDTSGNDYAGLSSTTAWSFTTAADTTAPTLGSTSPADNATGVSRTAGLTLTFSENVTPIVGGTVTIKKTSDNSTVESIDVLSGQVTGGGTSSIVVDPSVTLAYNTEYYVQVSAAAFEDAAGNDYGGLASTTAWSFTSEVDVTPPTVTLLYPLDDATNVSLSENFEITFSEDVAAVGGGTITLRKADNTLVESISATSGQVTIDGAVVTVNPTAPLEQEVNYYVVVSAGAFEDTGGGNDHAGIIGNTSWNFRTISSACNDLVDNDSDGQTDYPSDPGCAGTSDDAESPDDTDGDGISDQDEGEGDADEDGTPDYEETDADGDGISDEDEYSFEGGFINSCTAR